MKRFKGNNISKIIIDSRAMINYASYYLYGLIRLFGESVIKFKVLEYPIESHEDYRKGFGMLVKYTDGREIKIYVDTNDQNSIYETFYEWADLYAKVNVSKQDVDKPKLLAIGPSFGVQIWNPIKTIWLALINYATVARAQSKYRIPFTTFLKDYIYTFWRRSRYEKYRGGKIC